MRFRHPSMCHCTQTRRGGNSRKTLHQQVKQFKRQCFNRAVICPGASLSFFLFLTSARLMCTGFSSRCSYSSINSCSFRRLQDHPPPSSPTSPDCGERRENRMQREEWSYICTQKFLCCFTVGGTNQCVMVVSVGGIAKTSS